MSLMAYFKDEEICKDYLETIRWNGSIKCAYKDCGCTKVYKCAGRYKCSECERIFSVRVGTIFEDSKIPLQKWFAAIYLITSHKKGISSLQLHRDLGITQKTARSFTPKPAPNPPEEEKIPPLSSKKQGAAQLGARGCQIKVTHSGEVSSPRGLA